MAKQKAPREWEIRRDFELMGIHGPGRKPENRTLEYHATLPSIDADILRQMILAESAGKPYMKLHPNGTSTVTMLTTTDLLPRLKKVIADYNSIPGRRMVHGVK